MTRADTELAKRAFPIHRATIIHRSDNTYRNHENGPSDHKKRQISCRHAPSSDIVLWFESSSEPL
jgi:hypothetical protein